jgi:hypothetical protein
LGCCSCSRTAHGTLARVTFTNHIDRITAREVDVKPILILAAIGAVLFLAAWSIFGGSSGSWHQRLTVTVDTPKGKVSGAAVSEIRYTFYANPSEMTGREVSYDLTGEATVVEIVPGRYLFALIEGSEERFAMAAIDRFRGMTRGEWLRRVPRQTEPVILTGEAMPMLVTFDDVAKPETVRLVDPADLAASFGPGVSLKAMTLEITDEPVTEGRLDALLGWLGQYPETPMLSKIEPLDFSFAALLRQGSFIARE